MDLVTFSFACFNVLLKDPRLISAFVSRILALSSYFSDFSAKLSDKTSIRSVSSCVFVKWLLAAMIFTMGSRSKLVSDDWTLSLTFNQVTCLAC